MPLGGIGGGAAPAAPNLGGMSMAAINPAAGLQQYGISQMLQNTFGIQGQLQEAQLQEMQQTNAIQRLQQLTAIGNVSSMVAQSPQYKQSVSQAWQQAGLGSAPPLTPQGYIDVSQLGPTPLQQWLQSKANYDVIAGLSTDEARQDYLQSAGLLRNDQALPHTVSTAAIPYVPKQDNALINQIYKQVMSGDYSKDPTSLQGTLKAIYSAWDQLAAAGTDPTELMASIASGIALNPTLEARIAEQTAQAGKAKESTQEAIATFQDRLRYVKSKADLEQLMAEYYPAKTEAQIASEQSTAAKNYAQVPYYHAMTQKAQVDAQKTMVDIHNLLQNHGMTPDKYFSLGRSLDSDIVNTQKQIEALHHALATNVYPGTQDTLSQQQKTEIANDLATMQGTLNDELQRKASLGQTIVQYTQPVPGTHPMSHDEAAKKYPGQQLTFYAKKGSVIWYYAANGDTVTYDRTTGKYTTVAKGAPQSSSSSATTPSINPNT